MAEPELITLGLIGSGALARQLVAFFPSDRVRWVVLARSPQAGEAFPAHVGFASDLADLMAEHPRLVIEVASQQSVSDHVPVLLEAGIPVVAASVGALADPSIATRLLAARRQTGARLIIPSGSIGGLDYLEAVADLPDLAVRYTSRKPVAAWTAELAERGVDASSGEVVLFEGKPEEAARLYPKNLNAAFTIALAIRPAPLQVRVIADPSAKGNTHEIEVKSAAGEAFMRFVNAPSPDNPKTSAVTARSLALAVRRFLDEGRGN